MWIAAGKWLIVVARSGEFVQRGKNMVNEQGGRVTAAVDAGRQAYQNASGNPEAREF